MNNDTQGNIRLLQSVSQCLPVHTTEQECFQPSCTCTSCVTTSQVQADSGYQQFWLPLTTLTNLEAFTQNMPRYSLHPFALKTGWRDQYRSQLKHLQSEALEQISKDGLDQMDYNIPENCQRWCSRLSSMFKTCKK